MNMFWTMGFILLAGGGISFALARIAIRLQQPPGLAALAGVLICWQGVALMAGRAPLASAILLLMVAAGLYALVQWLSEASQLKARTALAGYIFAGLFLGLPLVFPVLTLEQFTAFSVAWFAAAAATLIASLKARIPVILLSPGLVPLTMLMIWLLVRGAVSLIAAPG
jgi:hypothetical protein